MSSSARQPLYNGRIVDLGLEEATLPNGAKVKLEIIRHPGAAAIVPIHSDGTVTLVRQYRHADSQVREHHLALLDLDDAHLQ